MSSFAAGNLHGEEAEIRLALDAVFEFRPVRLLGLLRFSVPCGLAVTDAGHLAERNPIGEAFVEGEVILLKLPGGEVLLHLFQSVGAEVLTVFVNADFHFWLSLYLAFSIGPRAAPKLDEL